MKKFSVMILCLIFAASGVSCAADRDSEMSPAQLANPVTELETPDFTAAGFKVTEYPTDCKLTRCAEIAGRVGEMDFDIGDGGVATFRMAKETGEDISGVYHEFTEETQYDFDGVTVAVKTAAEPSYGAVCTWNKDGYTFSLYIQAPKDETDPPELSGNFVKNIVVEPKKI